MRTFVVSNSQPTPSGRKQWRWENRDNDGHLLAAGPWETSPVRAMPARAKVAELAQQPDPMASTTRRRTTLHSVPLDDPGPAADVTRAAADLAG